LLIRRDLRRAGRTRDVSVQLSYHRNLEYHDLAIHILIVHFLNHKYYRYNGLFDELLFRHTYKQFIVRHNNDAL
jgi:hypothetical protein